MSHSDEHPLDQLRKLAPLDIDNITTRKVGRPPKLTDRTAKIIILGVQGDLPMNSAADLAGVSYEAIRLWRKRGEEERNAGKDNRYTRFFVALRHAKAGRRLELSAQATNPDAGVSNGVLFFLERQHGMRKVETQKVELSGAVDFAGASDEDLEELIAGEQNNNSPEGHEE